MSQSSDAIDFSRVFDGSADPPSTVARTAGLRQDAAFRTNVGVFSADPYHTRKFRATAIGERGSQSVILSVEPYSMAQVPLPDGDLGAMSIQFELLNEPALGADYPIPFVGYGSTVDNLSGDSWMTTAVPFWTTDHHSAASLIFPAGDVDGENGTHFQTDLTLTNYRDVPETVFMSLYAGFFYGDPISETEVTIPPLWSKTFRGVATDLLLSPGTFGVIVINDLNYYGRAGNADANLSATYRIWTPSTAATGGTMSYSAEAMDLQELPPGNQERVAIGVRLDSQFRCNVGIYSDSYYPSTFRITASSPSGSVTTTVTADSYQLTQVPLPDADLGYVTVTITPLSLSGERWTAYATSVDNLSGDSWLQNAEAR